MKIIKRETFYALDFLSTIPSKIVEIERKSVNMKSKRISKKLALFLAVIMTAVCILSGLAVSAGIPAGAVNLFNDTVTGGFDSTPGGRWRITNDTVTTYDAAKGANAPGSLKFTDAGTPGYAGLYYDNILLEPGVTYNISFKIFRDSACTTDAIALRVDVGEGNYTYAQVGGANKEWFAFTKTGEWETFTVSYTTTDDDGVWFEWYAVAGTGEFWIDDIWLYATPAPSTVSNSPLTVPTGAVNLFNDNTTGAFNSSPGGRWRMALDQAGSVTFDASVGADANGALKYVRDGSTGYQGLFYDNIKLEPGETYNVSFRVFRDAGSSTDAIALRVDVGEGNYTYAKINDSDNEWFPLTKVGEWETFNATYTTDDEDGVWFEWYVVAGTGTIYLDDVWLFTGEAAAGEPEEEVLGPNMIKTGNFETTDMSNWGIRSDWNGGTWARTAGAGVDGSFGFVVTGTGNGTSDQNAGAFYTSKEGTEADVVLLSGKTYRITFDVFRPNGVEGTARIDFNEGALGSGGSTKNGEWETVTFDFTVPASDSKNTTVKLRLVANALAEGQKITVDNLQLQQLGWNADTSDGMNWIALGAVITLCAAGSAMLIIRKKTLAPH